MKVNVHIGFDLDELKRLDDWREARRLTRGAAIMTLLDIADVPVPSTVSKQARVVEPVEE